MSALNISGGEQVDTTNIRTDADISHAPAADAGDEPATTGTAHWTDVTLDDVIAARDRIMPHLHRTPLVSSATLSRMTGTEIGLKAEVFQRTGSFKARGALNALLQLTEEQKARGVITLSAGNHGQGIAWAASQVGTKAVVFMPEGAVPTKVEAIRNYGAETKFAPTMETIVELVEEYQRQHGYTFISPYDDARIIAGQAVVGLEIIEDAPDVETVVVPVGGGGLLSGIALGIKSQRPDVRVIGVEPEGASVVRPSLAAGHPVKAKHIDTVADGLAAPSAGNLTQAIIEHYVDDVVLVSDDEIVNALWLILDRTKILVEPAGAAATAALLSGKAGARKSSRTVSVLSGGNIDPAKLKALLPG
jgi:threonine dehydratase